ncbi:MAG: peptidoglycan DD-metalloendopeptidase family protein [Proteobacteria bacterium]|nr:peptidoglycan DD-metalloendopeptidase family protein [Pseudomonadota bacterium]
MNRLQKTFKYFLGCAAGCTSVLIVQVFPAIGETPPRANLETVEKSLKDAREREQELSRKAAKAETEIAELRRRSIAIAARIQEHESILLTLEEKQATLERRKQSTTTSLTARRHQLAAMLAALQRISMHPPVALIALPVEPVDTIRSALLLRSTVPSVMSLGRALREDLDALADLTHAVIAARNKIVEEDAALTLQQMALTELETQKKTLAKETRHAHFEAQARAARLGKEARNLRELVARLAAKRTRSSPVARLLPAPPVAKRPKGAAAVAKLPPERILDIPALASDGLPVRGRIDRRFGHRLVNGGNTRGVSIKTRPGSMVIAPRDGLIVFAGPFRGLGQLLIIEYEAKYHLLLAGLGRIDKQVGENVLAGEPVGIMNASQNAGPALYLELRRNGQPINPLPWLAAGRTEVNG